MFLRVQDVLQMFNREYLKDFQISKENRTADLQKIVDFLEDYCRENKVCFVTGRGKRKCLHQKYLELFRRFLDRQLLLTFITHGSEEETVIPKQMWMPLSCI